MSSGTSGERFVEAFLTHNWDLVGLRLADDVVYRGVTTSQVAELNDGKLVLADLRDIFDEGETVTKVETMQSEWLPPVERVTYRFQTYIPSSGVSRRAEQHVFLTTGDDGKINKFDLLCSGWLPISDS